MNKEELLAMDLHEEKPIGARISVMRVFGGWIYSFMDRSIFVPETLNVEAHCTDVTDRTHQY